jgi:hypothetical protein
MQFKKVLFNKGTGRTVYEDNVIIQLLLSEIA